MFCACVGEKEPSFLFECCSEVGVGVGVGGARRWTVGVALRMAGWRETVRRWVRWRCESHVGER